MDDQTEALPDDVLANIFRRLEPCDLAASRCVGKAWHAAVDAHRLLLPHVLPHSVHGIFINYVDYERPHCFSRPSVQKPEINANLEYLPGYTEDFNPIIDHCNGLLLYEDFPKLFVVNPATRQWSRLSTKYDVNPYLVFDPAISPHYEVFLIPDVPKKVNLPVQDEQEDPHDSMEWPPLSWSMDVFSSSTRWQKRSFVRQGEAMGTVTSVRVDPLEPKSVCYGGPVRRYGVYWDGSLYVHCRGAFVARLSLSSGQYQVIKMPRDIGESINAQYLGKSEKGVSLATIYKEVHLQACRLRVFNLAESDGLIDWVLKHHVELEPLMSLLVCDFKGFKKTWTLDDDYDDDNDDYDGGEKENEEESGEENDGIEMIENMEWNSDDDNLLNIEDDYERFRDNLYFLGFHPYKEVIFLGISPLIGVAYHLRNSKIQYLGKLSPKGHANGIYEAYPYTPCMIGKLKKHASTSHHRG